MSNEKVRRMNNTDDNPFYSNEQSVYHTPDTFVINFKNRTAHIDKSNRLQVVNNKNIILDPYSMKRLLNTLKENIEKYEDKFGEIEKPETFEKAEELREEMEQDEDSVDEIGRPHYMG